jgi:hypothetical protein
MREERLDDPVYIRWRRQHPHFPGVAKCIELLRRRNVRGALVDIICHELQANATARVAELIAAFRRERDDRVRRILLGIIYEASLPEAFPLLMECLRSDEERMRYWAVEGLLHLDTPETRKVLFAEGRLSRADQNRRLTLRAKGDMTLSKRQSKTLPPSDTPSSNAYRTTLCKTWQSQ